MGGSLHISQKIKIIMLPFPLVPFVQQIYRQILNHRYYLLTQLQKI